MEADESLKQQFKLLQEQQQQKLLRRKQMKEEKENLSNNSTEKKTFGIDDNLDLKLEKSTGVGYLSEELFEHLNNEIRELKDENGRCYKLLSEREFEIKQLKKKKNEEKNALSGLTGAQITNETAATKIVELSKKVRELTAELESEKTRSKQISKKCHDLQMQMNTVPDDTFRSSLGSAVSQRSVYYTDNDKEQLEVDMKALQDKLKHTENKVAEFRNQSTQYKQELKLAHKALSQEVGENVNIQILLSGQSNWRGRAQQIILLQKKVEELKNQVDTTPKKSRDFDEDELENEFMGRTSSSKRRNQDEKYKEELKKYEKEKKEAYEKMASEFKALENDHSAVKSKFEAAKARNKVLSNENKSIKQQMTTLLEKGKNDDELIQALMKQQAQLKDMLDQTTSQQRQNNLNQVDKMKEMAVKSQQESNIVEQLKSIVSEKEIMVHRLEEEINQLKIQHLQKLQGEGQFCEKPVLAGLISRQTTDPMVLKSVSPPASRPPSGRIDSGRNSSRMSLVRPQSASNNTLQNQRVAELEYQCQEYKILLQTSEVERERLTELLHILQKRVDENIIKLNESQNELINQRRSNALLEKQVAKYKVEQAKLNKGNTTGRKKGPGNQGLSRLTSGDTSYNEEDHNMESLDELQTCLEIQKDENEALKSALQSTLNAKQEDLRIYSLTMDETKKVFLQALRQFKQTAAGT